MVTKIIKSCLLLKIIQLIIIVLDLDKCCLFWFKAFDDYGTSSAMSIKLPFDFYSVRTGTWSHRNLIGNRIKRSWFKSARCLYLNFRSQAHWINIKTKWLISTIFVYQTNSHLTLRFDGTLRYRISPTINNSLAYK